MPPLIVVAVLDLGANLLFAIATRHGLLSIVSVAGSLYPLATVVLARVILGERVRRVQELGIVAAIAGVVLIAAGLSYPIWTPLGLGFLPWPEWPLERWLAGSRSVTW